MSSLDDFLSRQIASIDGIQPEQVTDSFLRAIRQRMEKHSLYKKERTRDEQAAWDEICRQWAQEILLGESTPPTTIDYSN